MSDRSGSPGFRLASGAAPRHIALLAVLVAPACADRPDGRAFTVRDSAGVAIAVSTAPRWATTPSERWTIDGEPVLDLSAAGSGPEHEFFRVADAVRLSDGRIAVANSGSFQIRVYSAEGSLTQSIGREGEGPGEFGRLINLDRLPGDSLLVHSSRSRVTIIGPGLGVARTFDVDPLARRLQAFAGGIVGTLGTPMADPPDANTVVRLPEAVVRLDLEGTARADTLLMTRGSEALFFTSDQGPGGAPPLFARNTEVAASARELVLGLADSLSYDVYDGSGSLTRRVRVPGYDLALRADEVAEERAARLGRDPDPFLRKSVEALPTPRTRGAYDDLKIDATGHVWAGVQVTRTQRLERAPRDWNVFGPEGEWLGPVTMPAGFTPFEIGSEYVLGVRFDDLGVERVQILQLLKPGPPALETADEGREFGHPQDSSWATDPRKSRAWLGLAQVPPDSVVSWVAESPLVRCVPMTDAFNQPRGTPGRGRS